MHNSCLGISPKYLIFRNAPKPIIGLCGISFLCAKFEIFTIFSAIVLKTCTTGRRTNADHTCFYIIEMGYQVVQLLLAYVVGPTMFVNLTPALHAFVSTLLLLDETNFSNRSFQFIVISVIANTFVGHPINIAPGTLFPNYK